MGRPPLHPEIAKATGAAKRHPSRYQKEYVDIPLPLGDPPAHLNAAAKVVWHEINMWYPAEILKAADRHNVAVACEEMALYRESPRDFPTGRLSPMINLFGKLGGTPMDRLRMAKPKEDAGKKKDEFEDF